MASIERLTGARASLAIKAPVRVATTANITLSGAQTIDTISAVADDRVLVKDQSDAKENGIYLVANGAWARAVDFNKDNDIAEGTQVWVNGGTVSARRNFTLDTASPVIGTSDLVFSNNAYQSSGQTIATASLLTLAHGLGVSPRLISTYLKCLSAEHGYSIDDEVWVDVHAVGSSGVTRIHSITFDATNILFRFTSSSTCYTGAHKDTGAGVNMTNASWKLYVRASR